MSAPNLSADMEFLKLSLCLSVHYLLVQGSVKVGEAPANPAQEWLQGWGLQPLPDTTGSISTVFFLNFCFVKNSIWFIVCDSYPTLRSKFNTQWLHLKVV